MKGFLLAVPAALCLTLVATPAGAQRIGGQSGVPFADPNEKVEGPATIAGTRSYDSPLPYFHDLAPWDPNYKPPRTSGGHPDLQGVWSTASLTTMARGGDRGLGLTELVIPPEKIADLTSKAHYTQNWINSQKRTDPNAGVFTDKDVAAGYNTFWSDPGSEWAKVDTEWRSSWITSPANGQVPFNEAGRSLRGARMKAVRTVDNTRGPEIRTVRRSLSGLFRKSRRSRRSTTRSTTITIRSCRPPDSLAIVVEINHDVRIVRVERQGRACFPADGFATVVRRQCRALGE